MSDQDKGNVLFTFMCKIFTERLPGMNCHEAQLHYKLFLCKMTEAGVKHTVPNFWSDEYNHFPMTELVKLFNANGWKNLRWVGDADCKECFHMDTCGYYGTGSVDGITTKEKLSKHSKHEMSDHLMILYIMKKCDELKIPLEGQTLEYLILKMQMEGVPFSYKFMLAPGKVIISSRYKIPFDEVNSEDS